MKSKKEGRKGESEPEGEFCGWKERGREIDELKRLEDAWNRGLCDRKK